MLHSDAFEQAYTAGILDELPRPEARLFASARPTAAPAAPFALRGCVITPEERIDDGYVVVSGSLVSAVGASPPPAGTPVVETGGVILPGLIDLHGHPEFNIFAAWEPPKLYANRGRWRDSAEYRALVRDPMNKLKDVPEMPRKLTRYAEVRALVGGVTAIQGASGRYPQKEEALVRNVDLWIFGQHRARSIIDLGLVRPEAAQRLRGQIDAGEVTALYVHLAEGVDQTSRRELAELTEAGLLTPATVVIHGTALGDADLQAVRDAGAKLVWSPQSNLRLYGQTTSAARARALGIPIGLGADWLPSGSTSLLAEMKVAQQALRSQGDHVPARALVDMVTRDAARIAGLGDSLGTIAPGRPADLTVLERRVADPWENVVAAMPSWVDLVVVGGDLAYGRRDWLAALIHPDRLTLAESLVAWGKPMTIDTSYSVRATATAPPRLADLRADILAAYTATGPIFA